jgi:micrococcal nuclease
VALDDGRTVRLADVRAPEPEAMTAALGELVGRRVAVSATARPDRWGRTVGDIAPLPAGDGHRKDTSGGFRADAVARGLALVDPVDISQPCLAELFGVERTAEASRQGIWRTSLVVPAAADGLPQQAGRYVLVDGVVASVGETRQTLYLNFGDNWRTDFTALMRRRDASDWGLVAADLAGRRVRVRGVLEAWNGGLIRIEHPAQVELLPGG